jgi:hypothetical protein
VTGALLATAFRIGPALSAAAVPTDVSGYGNSGAAANITTALVIATPTGGVSPYTFAWVQTSTSPYTWVIGAASSASTSFTCNTLGAGATAEADFEVTITDALGNSATATVTAFANNGQPYDGRIDRTSGGPIP